MLSSLGLSCALPVRALTHYKCKWQASDLHEPVGGQAPPPDKACLAGQAQTQFECIGICGMWNSW